MLTIPVRILAISISSPMGCSRAMRRASLLTCPTGNGTANRSAQDHLSSRIGFRAKASPWNATQITLRQGKPYLDKLVFRIVPEPAAQTAMMMNGEAQVHLWPGEITR